MSNPIIENGFAPQNANLRQLKYIMQMIKASQNPQMLLQQFAQQNPQMAQIMQLVQGRDPQQVFYEMCQQRGIDPNSILNQLK